MASRRFPFSLQVVIVAAFAFAAMWISTPHPRGEYDYTSRIAGCLLNGQLGMADPAPPWLNEMVSCDGRFYSVFPLGSVLSVLPAQWLVAGKMVRPFPLRFVLSVIAAGITVLAYALACRYPIPAWKRVCFAAAPLFGTCLWPNLSFGGSWQMAIGFSVLGMFAAIYFSTGNPRPFLAGCGFAVAFGNRTEALLTAPAIYFFLWRNDPPKFWLRAAAFSIVPALLGIATLAYNDARFGSPLDFGYARIPGVLDEPWYRDGIFAFSAIPRNAYAMLVEPWKRLPGFPWIVPSGWGGSILLHSPFLLLLVLRIRRGDFQTRIAAWLAIAVLTFLLWIHGNPGGWQVSYRYAGVLFPWAFLLLLEGESEERIGWAPALILASMAVNGYAAWIFCETPYMAP